MLNAIHIPFLLCTLVYCGETAAPPCDAQVAFVELALENDSEGGSAVIVISANGAEEDVRVLKGKKMLFLTDEDSDDRHIVQQLPNVWIGVRVTPVPKPLAAHIGREGLMVANVAEGSPADQAGLEQYDVIVSFDGVNVEDMNDLLDAISEAGAGGEAEVTLVRGGKVTNTTITPTKRTEMGEVVFKYEESEDAEHEKELEKYFGHRMKIGPGGGAFVMPHGRMHLPDNVRDILAHMPDFEWGGDFDLDDLDDLDETLHELNITVGDLNSVLDGIDLPFGMKVEIDADDDGAMRWIMKHDADEAREINIKISEDGETVAIHRDEDGVIHVEREDADGSKTSDTYEDAETLRENDPDAYGIYRRFSAGHGPAMFLAHPDLKDLGLRQKKFEVELRGALGSARKAHGDARKAFEKAHKAHRRVKIHREAAADDARAEVRTEMVMIGLGDDGRITIEIKEDGATRKYEFDSREDFEKSEPELYEKYGEHIEKVEGARGDAARVALV